MNTRKALLERRTIHFYETTPLPEGAIERALEAAVRAPNHKLTNPWRFIVVGPETRERITEWGVELKREKQRKRGGEMSEQKAARVRAKYSDPPELVVVCQALKSEDDDFRRREDYAAVACAIQNMHVSLWSEGIGSKWSSGSLTYHEKTYEILGVDPEEAEIVGFIWAGYPKIVPDPDRRPLDEVVRTTS